VRSIGFVDDDGKQSLLFVISAVMTIIFVLMSIVADEADDRSCNWLPLMLLLVTQ
jgi:uncharacterized Tic20 family protein